MLDNHGITELQRGFRYGDGFFDTALVFKGRVVWAADHEKRMRFAADVLGLELPWQDVHDWQMKASMLWNHQGQPEFGRLRTLVWRKWGEGYRPGGATSVEQMEFDVLDQCPVRDSSHSLRLGPSDIIKCPPTSEVAQRTKNKKLNWRRLFVVDFVQSTPTMEKVSSMQTILLAQFNQLEIILEW